MDLITDTVRISHEFVSVKACDTIPAKQLSNFMGKLQIRIVYDNIYLNCWDPVKTK